MVYVCPRTLLQIRDSVKSMETEKKNLQSDFTSQIYHIYIYM